MIIRSFGTFPSGHVMYCSVSTTASSPSPLRRSLQEYQKEFPDIPIGYSGHESGVHVSVAAVALGAKVIERHVTLDKSWKGSDHGASLEPQELQELVASVRLVEAALGSPTKTMLPCERPCHDKVGPSPRDPASSSSSVPTSALSPLSPPAGQVGGGEGPDPQRFGSDCGAAGGEGGRASGGPGRGHLPAGGPQGDPGGGPGPELDPRAAGRRRQEGQVLRRGEVHAGK